MKKLRTLIFILFSGFISSNSHGQSTPIDFTHSIHRYFEKLPQDPFSKFKRKVESGIIKLNFESEKKYLLSLLDELSISPHSQLLVYSTTSLQLSRISPTNPRAIYFTDDIYLGYVPGGQIEIIGIDPQLGAIPYIFNLPKENDFKHPTIHRSKRCMNCHASPDIGGAPGLLIASVVPGPGGGSIDAFRKKISGHGVPYEERFGGWHITGQHPFIKTWANQTGEMRDGNINKIPNPPGKYFTWEKYLTEKSDLIPHLLLEHQIGFTNRCIATTYKFREQAILNRDAGNMIKVNDLIEEETQSLLSYILFKNEVLLPENKINSETQYVLDFENSNTSNPKGKDLRKLNLKTRLFNLRCSYMIFSNSFTGLPSVIKAYLINELHFILSCDRNKIPPAFSYLGNDERKEIKQILSTSLIGFPED